MAGIDKECQEEYADKRTACKDTFMAMNISLTPHLEEMIRAKIASGSYNSASEVVREALRLLEEEDKLRSLKLRKLREDINEGLESGPSTAFDPEEIKRLGRAKGLKKSKS
jgi:antitoxin ParD1/3/4